MLVIHSMTILQQLYITKVLQCTAVDSQQDHSLPFSMIMHVYCVMLNITQVLQCNVCVILERYYNVMCVILDRYYNVMCVIVDNWFLQEQGTKKQRTNMMTSIHRAILDIQQESNSYHTKVKERQFGSWTGDLRHCMKKLLLINRSNTPIQYFLGTTG